MTNLQRQTSKLAILALAVSMSVGAIAQSPGTGGSTGGASSGSSAGGNTGGNTGGTTGGTAGGATGGTAAGTAGTTGASGSSNGPASAGGTVGSSSANSGGMTSSSLSFQQWLNAQQGKRISRQAYMDEVGRRWDAMDRSSQGLTYDEINRTYGAAGNMGGPTANTPTQRSGMQK